MQHNTKLLIKNIGIIFLILAVCTLFLFGLSLTIANYFYIPESPPSFLTILSIFISSIGSVSGLIATLIAVYAILRWKNQSISEKKLQLIIDAEMHLDHFKVHFEFEFTYNPIVHGKTVWKLCHEDYNNLERSFRKLDLIFASENSDWLIKAKHIFLIVIAIDDVFSRENNQKNPTNRQDLLTYLDQLDIELKEIKAKV